MKLCDQNKNPCTVPCFGVSSLLPVSHVVCWNVMFSVLCLCVCLSVNWAGSHVTIKHPITHGYPPQPCTFKLVHLGLSPSPTHMGTIHSNFFTMSSIHLLENGVVISTKLEFTFFRLACFSFKFK